MSGIIPIVMLAAQAPPPASQPARPAIDHAPLSELLKKHVSSDGTVAYAALRKDADHLDKYLASLRDAKTEQLHPDDRTALWLNAFNALTLRLILDAHPIRAISDIPEDRRHKARWKLAGQSVGLDDIANERLSTSTDPRIHFALCRGYRGSPPLRSEAYDSERLSDQLDDQAQRFHRDERFVRFDASQNTLHLARLYEWHAGDFKKQGDSVLPYVAAFVPELARALRKGTEVTIRWIECDFALNDAPPKEPEK